MSPAVLTYSLDMLDLSALTALVWEAMGSKWKREGHYPVTPSYRASYHEICMSVAELAARKGKITVPPAPGYQPFSRNVSSDGRKKVGSVLWSLVAQEILYIDMPQNTMTGEPYFVFDITEYGLQVIAAGSPIPHDPDGYLAYLKTEIPDIDTVIYTYISESIEAYNHRLYLSATTAIGCASEKAFSLLLDAYIQFLPSQKERDNINKLKNQQIKRQFEAFQKSFGGHKGQIDNDLIDGIDIVFSGIFELLRQNRNSTGHPTGKSMSKDRVFASLQLFVTYCKRIYELIDFFTQNVAIVS